jgi:hypothetical protein
MLETDTGKTIQQVDLNLSACSASDKSLSQVRKRGISQLVDGQHLQFSQLRNVDPSISFLLSVLH